MLALVSVLLLTMLPSAAIAAPQTAAMQSSFYYTVKRGDTLYGIARYYGVSAHAIMDANGISNPNRIYVGQRLLIPGGYTPPPPAPGCAYYHRVQYGQTLAWIATYYGVNVYTLAQVNGIYNINHIHTGANLCIPGGYIPPQPPPPPPPNADPCNYIVRRGDTLALIARWYGTSVYEIMRLNNIYNPNIIEVGQRLVLPGCIYPPPNPTPTPNPTPFPPGSIGYWSAFYYSNPDLSGAPAWVTQTPTLNYDWGLRSPGDGIPADNFGAIFARNDYFQAGTYRFFATVDDGVRLYVDDKLIIDAWRVQPATNYFADVYLAAGYHLLRVEYYEAGDVAKLVVNWVRL
jgi:LysM repeat protein